MGVSAGWKLCKLRRLLISSYFIQDIMELQEVKNNAEFDKILADYSR